MCLHYFSMIERPYVTFSGSRVCACTLTSHRQPSAMTQTTITTQIHQPLDAHGNFATQIAFNDEFVDFSAQFFKFAVIQILDLFGWSDAGYGTDILCAWTSNTINSRQAITMC